MGEGEWEVQAPSYGMNKPCEKKVQHRNDTQLYSSIIMVTDDSYTYGEHSIMYKLIESLFVYLKLM